MRSTARHLPHNAIGMSYLRLPPPHTRPSASLPVPHLPLLLDSAPLPTSDRVLHTVALLSIPTPAVSACPPLFSGLFLHLLCSRSESCSHPFPLSQRLLHHCLASSPTLAQASLRREAESPCAPR